MKKLLLSISMIFIVLMAYAQSCPDGKHPHAIDLGLPSGTKWACCNVGATTPEGYGGYYAWGEKKTKSVYNEVAYKYLNSLPKDSKGKYAIVAFEAKNTMTENGAVKRGVAFEDKQGNLNDCVASESILNSQKPNKELSHYALKDAKRKLADFEEKSGILRDEYEEKYGPIVFRDSPEKRMRWIKNPWPWDLCEED